jgi:DNA-binding NarL/FixJ family response regulator
MGHRSRGVDDMKMKHKLKVAGRRRRVFLVDQFPVSRVAVLEWLKQKSDLTLCGQAASPKGALTFVRDLKPDVVVTEIMRQQDLGFIRNLRECHPRLPILVFSFRDEEWYAPQALEARADGYLMKGVNRSDLIEGIRGALEGRIVLSSEMRARVLRKCFARHPASALTARRCRHRGSPAGQGRR